jgi:hypothetical protein
MSSRPLCVAVADVALALLSAGTASAQEPAPMTLSRAGLRVDGSSARHVHGHLPVKRRGTVALELAQAAASVQAWLVRDGEQVGAPLRVERSSARGWLVRLPERLRRARALEVAADGVTYRGGIRTRAGCGGAAARAAHASQTLDSFVLPDVRVISAGVSTGVRFFAFCGTDFCADGVLPRDLSRLPVRPERRVVVQSSFDLDAVSVQLLRRVARDRVDWSSAPIDARRVTARRWAVVLPARLHRANLLVVSTGWPGGSANGAIGIRARCGS